MPIGVSGGLSGGAAPRTVSLSTKKWITLSATSHTIEVRWRTSANTVTSVSTDRILVIEEYNT